MINRRLIGIGIIALAAPLAGQTGFSWPEPTAEMKPWVYNWWMGSAVSRKGLVAQMDQLAEKGFGGLHVIPVYGVKGNEKKDRALLSPKWVDAWNAAARLARQRGLGIDLTMGSGWCFGGPWIDEAHAASSKVKVKRAGRGGNGYMIDPFSPASMSNHVERFTALFGRGGTAERPRAFYHDSYEYYGAKPKTPGSIDELQIATFRVWSEWCRTHGYLSRNEAHGAPANWLDLYALADIPETEMFGKGDRDILISKFASSAAHAKGTRLVSAESCTWVDEHFCERPREIKQFLDRLFLSGVNHVFYHGLCYSPPHAPWPGWCFYATLQMNPRNPIWREVESLNRYVTRCQSIFQTWTPDNDLALIWDAEPFQRKNGKKVRQMSVHGRQWFYGEPIGKAARTLYDSGYSFDYLSPRMLAAGLGKKYVEVIDPAHPVTPRQARRMPFDAASGLLATRWRKNGKTLYFVANQGGKGTVQVEADEPFTVMDPLTGRIARMRKCAIEPDHSLFISDAKGLRGAPVKISRQGVRMACAAWTVEPLTGGPALPEVRVIPQLVGWETWDAAFSGTMRYTTSVDFTPSMLKTCLAGSQTVLIDLGDVREIARVKVNGVDLGVAFMPPYAVKCRSSLLKEKGNVLEVEVTNLGANRLRWNDMTGVKWKIFHNINVVGLNYKPLDASTYPLMPSGLLGPVMVYPHREDSK